MRVKIPTESTESNFDNEFVVVPAGEYAVTADIVFAGETYKGNPKLSIPFTITGGVYPLDAGGLLQGQIPIDGSRVIGPNDYVSKRFWFNLYPKNFLLLSHIVDNGELSSLTNGQRKNGEIVAQQLAEMGLPEANDPNDPFNYATFPMDFTEATSLIRDFLTELYREEPLQLRVRTETYTYGENNTPAVQVKSLRRYNVSKAGGYSFGKSVETPSYYGDIPY